MPILNNRSAELMPKALHDKVSKFGEEFAYHLGILKFAEANRWNLILQLNFLGQLVIHRIIAKSMPSNIMYLLLEVRSSRQVRLFYTFRITSYTEYLTSCSLTDSG